MQRLQKLLAAGVTSFLDLTEEEELPAYQGLLSKLTEQPIRHRRWAITDHGIPESPNRMSDILDYLDAELRAGRCVYVHCRAGIGRTGTTVACHLIRTGLANDAALDQLQALWRFCARSQNWPQVPETDEQIEFVRTWRDRPSASASASVEAQARYEGAIVGLAMGDALAGMVASSGYEAATVIARTRELGMWSAGANTATTRAVLESLLAQGKHEPRDQLQRYLDWTRETTAPVPPELKRALAVWQWSKKVQAGSHDPKNLDPHSLARTLAPALYLAANAGAALELAVEISRTTQQSPVVLDLCRVWCATFIDALNGTPAAALRARTGPAMNIVRKRQLKPAAKTIIDGVRSLEPAVPDDALAVTAYAFTRFAEARNFQDALLSCVAARATSTAAASLCGALAGAHYGIESIPAEWRAKLLDGPALRSLARHCLH